MTKSKLTKNQQAFKREIQNLKRRIRRAENAGYKEINITIPEMPKRVTKKTIEDIKKIRGEKIYEKSQYFITNEETGEVISPSEVKAYKTQQRIEKQLHIKRKQALENFLELEKDYYTGAIERIYVLDALDDYIDLLPDEEKPIKEKLLQALDSHFEKEELKREKAKAKNQTNQAQNDGEITYNNVSFSYESAYNQFTHAGDRFQNSKLWFDFIKPSILQSGLTHDEIGYAYLLVISDIGDISYEQAYDENMAKSWVETFFKHAETIKGEEVLSEKQEEILWKRFYDLTDSLENGEDYEI